MSRPWKPRHSTVSAMFLLDQSSPSSGVAFVLGSCLFSRTCEQLLARAFSQGLGGAEWGRSSRESASHESGQGYLRLVSTIMWVTPTRWCSMSFPPSGPVVAWGSLGLPWNRGAGTGRPRTAGPSGPLRYDCPPDRLERHDELALVVGARSPHNTLAPPEQKHFGLRLNHLCEVNDHFHLLVQLQRPAALSTWLAGMYL
jgi:hypothetical protein